MSGQSMNGHQGRERSLGNEQSFTPRDERDLLLAMDAIPAAAWSTRADGSADFFNQDYLGYAGLSTEELSGWQWKDIIHPDDLPGLVRTWEGMMAQEEEGKAEARFRRHDGEYRWFSLRGKPLRDENGNVIRWFGVNTDIEDQKRATTMLAREQVLLEMTVSGRPLPEVLHSICTFVEGAAPGCCGEVLVLDFPAPVIEYCVAPRFAQNYTDRLTRAPLDAEVSPGITAAIRREIVVAQDLAGDSRWEASSAKIDLLAQGFRSAWAAPIFSREGRALAVFSIYGPVAGDLGERHQDLLGRVMHIAGIAIERWRGEEELRRSAQYLAIGEHISQTGSFCWHVDTDKLTSSEQHRRLLEFPEEEISAAEYRTRIHPDDIPILERTMAQLQGGLANTDYEIRLMMPDGRVKYCRAFSNVIQHRDGRMECIGATQDITSWKLAQNALDKVRDELAHVVRVMTLGELTASIAHEINQPLSGIMTNASTCLRMLASDPPNIDGAKETARRTLRDGDRASEVIKRLRALFQKKDFVVEPVDLNEAAREVIALSTQNLQRRGIQLLSGFAHTLPLVAGDRIQLQQVILNLVLNAADAVESVRDRPRQVIVETREAQPGQVEFSVRDTGEGIPADDAARIFDAFFTTKPEGMGIGLSVSRSIIDRHDGTIQATANDGPGTTFVVTLPNAVSAGPVTPRL